MPMQVKARAVGIVRAVGIPALVFFMCAPPVPGLAANADYQARVARVLKQTPLIDGHNDLPWEIRERFKGALAAIDLNSDTSKLPVPAVRRIRRR